MLHSVWSVKNKQTKKSENMNLEKSSKKFKERLLNPLKRTCNQKSKVCLVGRKGITLISIKIKFLNNIV